MDNSTKKFIDENTEKLLAAMSSYAQRMDKQFEKIDKQFENIDKQFEQIDKQFEKVGEQFKGLRGEMNERFDTVDASLGRQQQEIDVLRNRIGLLENEVGIR